MDKSRSRHIDCGVSSLLLCCGDLVSVLSFQLYKSSILSVLCSETLARITPQLSSLFHFLFQPSSLVLAVLFVFPTLISSLFCPLPHVRLSHLAVSSLVVSSMTVRLTASQICLSVFVTHPSLWIATSFHLIPVTLSPHLHYLFRQHRSG